MSPCCAATLRAADGTVLWGRQCPELADRTLWWADLQTGAFVESTHECRAHAVESYRLGPRIIAGAHPVATFAGVRQGLT